MKISKIKLSWQLILPIVLIISSTLLYFIHYQIFHDSHHVFIYLVGDIAFVPLEVLLVTIVLHRLLEHKSKKEKLNKLNMVIGVFFSEVGTSIIKEIIGSIKNQNEISTLLLIDQSWNEKKFKSIITQINLMSIDCIIKKNQLQSLNENLIKHRSFLLSLLENANLLEHESFTDMLWALFHLAEELTQRNNLEEISDEDLHHLVIDIIRVYQRILREWISYMKHLKSDYPYLFSFALRTSPFDKNAKIEF